jgi:UDP-N-acetylglucosamine 2-epimerase (non-hydrolysing)
MLRGHQVVLVLGTRPEAIKLAPVACALDARGADVRLYVTGQHPGLRLAEHGLGGFAMTRLDCPGQPDPNEHVALVADALAQMWSIRPPRLVLVQGDTSSALGGARAALSAAVAFGHVEAGLRSHDPAQPWPEEGYRREIDRGAALLFAPTTGNAANLRGEGCGGEIHVTGNSGVDALVATIGAAPREARRRNRRGLRLLVTCHRRENWGAGIVALAAALRQIGAAGTAEAEVVLPPNPVVAADLANALGGASGVRLVAPMGHSAMIAAMRRCDLLVSDSGGMQEEAAQLGVPLLVLRTKTERPEAIANGNALLVGTDRAAIVAAIERLAADRAQLAAMARPAMLFGDGRAGPRIAELALAWLDRQRTWSAASPGLIDKQADSAA